MLRQVISSSWIYIYIYSQWWYPFALQAWFVIWIWSYRRHLVISFNLALIFDPSLASAKTTWKTHGLSLVGRSCMLLEMSRNFQKDISYCKINPIHILIGLGIQTWLKKSIIYPLWCGRQKTRNYPYCRVFNNKAK